MKAPVWEKQSFQHLAPAPFMSVYLCVIALSPSFPFCLSETGSYCVYPSLVHGEAGLKIKTVLLGLPNVGHGDTHKAFSPFYL